MRPIVGVSIVSVFRSGTNRPRDSLRLNAAFSRLLSRVFSKSACFGANTNSSRNARRCADQRRVTSRSLCSLQNLRRAFGIDEVPWSSCACHFAMCQQQTLLDPGQRLAVFHAKMIADLGQAEHVPGATCVTVSVKDVIDCFWRAMEALARGLHAVLRNVLRDGFHHLLRKYMP
jgi:hypothetical protein